MDENSKDSYATKTRVDSIDEYVSKQMKQRRLMLGISQQEIARALRLSIQQIQKYEAGNNRLSSSKLYQIAKSLRTPIDYFFEGIEEYKKKYDEASFADEKVSFDFEIDIVEMPDKDIINLVNCFKTIQDISVRKNILDLVKSLAK